VSQHAQKCKEVTLGYYVLFLSYNMWLHVELSNYLEHHSLPRQALKLGDQKRLSLAREPTELRTQSIGGSSAIRCEIEAVKNVTAWWGPSVWYPPAIYYLRFDCALDDSVDKCKRCCTTKP
jgi:hypothetical protein